MLMDTFKNNFKPVLMNLTIKVCFKVSLFNFVIDQYETQKAENLLGFMTASALVHKQNASSAARHYFYFLEATEVSRK